MMAPVRIVDDTLLDHSDQCHVIARDRNIFKSSPLNAHWTFGQTPSPLLLNVHIEFRIPIFFRAVDKGMHLDCNWNELRIEKMLNGFSPLSPDIIFKCIFSSLFSIHFL